MKQMRSVVLSLFGVLAATVYGAIPVSRLDVADCLHFHTENDVGEWYGVEGAGWSGGTAITPLHNGYDQSLYADVYTNGTIHYKYMMDAYLGGSTGLFGIDWDKSGKWLSGSVEVSVGDDQYLLGICMYDSSDKFYISDVEFVPAPESMTVTFDLNGGSGEPPASRVYSPGRCYNYPNNGGNYLPKPERPGFSFAGWCIDTEDGEMITDYHSVAFRDHTLVAAWYVPVSNLEVAGVTFESAGVQSSWINAPWNYVEGAGIGGCPALVSGKIVGDEDSRLQIDVSGCGKLVFNVQASGHEWASHGMYADGEDYIALEVNSLNTWYSRTVTFDTDEDHTVELNVYGSSGTDAKIMLCNFEWIPAPESMTVSFDTNGGTRTYDDKEYAPGDCYGTLPTPVRSGYTFLGWYNGSTMGTKVTAKSKVDYEENITLVAKWGKSVSAFSATGVSSFTVTGDDKWHTLDWEGGKVLEVEPNGKLKKYSYYGGGSEEYWGESTSTLQATINKSGYYTFNWMLQRGEDMSWAISWISAQVFIDGKSVGHIDSFDENDRWETVCFYIGSGKHTVKWVVEGCRAAAQHWIDDEWEYEYSESSPVFRLANFTFEAAGAQPDLQTWLKKVRKFNAWNTGNLSKFRDIYARRYTTDPKDYEARFLHAVCTLGILAENAEFKTILKTFGGTVDFMKLNVTGTATFNSKSTASNKVCDRVLAIGGPAIKTALADLEAIPLDGSEGTLIRLSAEEWPIDEDVSIDAADIKYMMSGLYGALAGMNYAAGHDLTLDWAKIGALSEMDSTAVPKVTSIPKITDDEGWSKALLFRCDLSTDVGGAANVRVCRAGSKFAALYDCPSLAESDVSLYYANFVLQIGGKNHYLWLDIDQDDPTAVSECWVSYGESEEDWTEKCVPATVSISEGRLLVTITLTSIPKAASGMMARLGDLAFEGYDDNFTALTAGWDCVESDRHQKLKKLIETQPSFFSKVRDFSRVEESRSLVKSALESALAADELMASREDDGGMHFVEYDPQDSERVSDLREKANLALTSLTSPQQLDLWSIVDDSKFDVSLVPNDGLLTVYLGALFDGCFNAKLLPSFSLSDYRMLVPDIGTLPDPTFAGLFPDMTYDAIARIADDIDGVDYEYSEPIGEIEHPVPGTVAKLVYEDFIGYTVTGKPKDWKWNPLTGELSGTAKENFTVTFTRNGKSYRRAITLAPLPALSVEKQCEGDAVIMVTGDGRYAANTKVKLLAAVSAETSFLGWYDAEDQLISKDASYSLTMPATDTLVIAKAIPIRDDYLSGWSAAKVNDFELALGEPVDESVGNYFDFDSVSPYTVSASGLPTGVSVVQSECGRYALKGVPRKKGVYVATIVGKNNAGYTCSIVLRFLDGGATVSQTNTADIEFEYETFFLGEDVDIVADVPSSCLVGDAKSVSVKGQPTGLKASYKDGTLTLTGVPTKVGKFDTTITVNYPANIKATMVKSFFVQGTGCAYVGAYVGESVAGGTVRGKVTGGGLKPYGTKLTFKATSANAKKYFFTGWYLDKACTEPATELFGATGWKNATATRLLTLKERAFDVYAEFITKEEDAVKISCDDTWRVESDDGEYEKFGIEVDSRTTAKLSSGTLPSGIKLSGSQLIVSAAKSLKPGNYTVTLTAKTATGAVGTRNVQIVVPNLTDAVDRGYLSLDTSDEGYVGGDGFMQVGINQSFTLADLGIYAEEGWTIGVTGLPKEWSYSKGKITGTTYKAGKYTVTFTVTNKAKKSYKATATFGVVDLPSWAQGTFVGAIVGIYGEEMEEGTITFTVSAGKVSGSYSVGGDKTTFSASALAFEKDGAISAKAKGKVDGSNKTFDLFIMPNAECSGCGTAYFCGAVSSTEYIETVLIDQNPWTNPEKEELGLPVIKAGLSSSFEWYGNRFDYDMGTVTLKFSESGTASAVFKSAKGSVTGSAQLAGIRYSGENRVARMVIGVPHNKSKKIPGTYCIVNLVLGEGEDGNVVEIYPESDGMREGIWGFFDFF